MSARPTHSRKSARNWRIVLTIVALLLALLWMSGLGAHSVARHEAPGASMPGDPARGRLLYENHCRACHTSQVHIRERRMGVTPATVRNLIAGWGRRLGLQWTEQERSDVFHFLNQRYYQFSKSP